MGVFNRIPSLLWAASLALIGTTFTIFFSSVSLRVQIPALVASVVFTALWILRANQEQNDLPTELRKVLDERQAEIIAEVKKVDPDDANLVMETVRFADQLKVYMQNEESRALLRVWRELGKPPYTGEPAARLFKECEEFALRCYKREFQPKAEELLGRLTQKLGGLGHVPAGLEHRIFDPASSGEVEQVAHNLDDMAKQLSHIAP